MPPVAYSRAAARTASGATPVTSALASGELCGAVMNARHFSNAGPSQRSRTKASSYSPSVITTCASALIIATLVPGRSCR